MSAPPFTAPSRALPALAVYSESESFSAVWPGLASECGFALERLGPGQVSAADSAKAIILSIGGVEERLEQALGRLEPNGVAPVVVGGLPDHRLALRAARLGAADYFALPQDLELLKGWLRDQADRLRRAATSERFATREASKYRFEGILGESQALRDTLERAARVIPHGGVTVLITGETGTGKELLARAIHYNGPRRSAPFVDVNCAAIPENLLESELFGHEKGAFTDAVAAKPGLFEVAGGGTIFLDEIGHLSPQLQGKLLRVLEQRQIRRVGGTTTLAVDVRVIAATHVDLAEAVRQGQFREDLYYRLNVVGLRLPALRERSGDVLLLARAFLTRFAREYGLPEPVLTPAAEHRLLAYRWSGNIRELRNVLERAILLGNPGRLDEGDLALEERAAPADRHGVPFPATMSEITRAAALAMVGLCSGNKSEAARRLRISRTRLLRLLARSRSRTAPEVET
jgi:DNA-binding NtrC family response regulator